MRRCACFSPESNEAPAIHRRVPPLSLDSTIPTDRRDTAGIAASVASSLQQQVSRHRAEHETHTGAYATMGAKVVSRRIRRGILTEGTTERLVRSPRSRTVKERDCP
jgi:hypothetical protein